MNSLGDRTQLTCLDRISVPAKAITIRNANKQDVDSVDHNSHTLSTQHPPTIPPIVVKYSRQNIEEQVPAYSYSSGDSTNLIPAMASKGTFPDSFTDYESDTKQDMDPVEEFLSGLDLTGHEAKYLAALQIPREQRIYSIEYLQMMRTDRTIPRPFINVPPGKFADMRLGIKIAYIAQEQGITLTDAFWAYGHGKFQIPDSPELEKEARRHVSRPSSPLELDIQPAMEKNYEADSKANKMSPLEEYLAQESLIDFASSPSEGIPPDIDFDSIRVIFDKTKGIADATITEQVPSEDSTYISTKKNTTVQLDQAPQLGNIPEEPVADAIIEPSLENKANLVQELSPKSTQVLGVSMDIDSEPLLQVPSTSPFSATISLVDILARSNGLSLDQALNLIKISLVDAQKQFLAIHRSSVKSLDRKSEDYNKNKRADLDIKDIEKERTNPGTEEVEELQIVEKHESDLTSTNPPFNLMDAPETESITSEVKSDSGIEDSIDLPRNGTPERADSEFEYARRCIKVKRPTPYTWHEWQIDCPAPADTILPEDKQFHCQFCMPSKAYKTVNRIIDHLENKHFYCEKCEYAYAEREDLMEHLSTKKDVHNYCELCNIDFHTVEGHVRHFKSVCSVFVLLFHFTDPAQTHPPTDDPIDCPGCRVHCDSAVDVVCHLEAGLCRNISKPQFQRARVLTALIQRYSLGPLQTCSNDDKEGIRAQSLIVLQGDKSVVEGLPLVKESGWSPFFAAQDHQIKTYSGLQYKCPYQYCALLFKEQADFVNHLRSGHFDHGMCPGCAKEFNLPSALLQHMIAGKRNCYFDKGRIFEYAVAAISGGYIKTDELNAQGRWRFVAGIAPRAELYMDLPQVTGLK